MPGLSILQNPQLTLPPAAANVSFTPGASGFGNNSAYVELVSSLSGGGILTGISVKTTALAFGTNSSFEIDVATGAASSESIIATFGGMITGVNDSREMTVIQTVIGIDNIANNARLSARMRTDATIPQAWSVAATYLTKPLTGAGKIQTTANVLKTAPSAATAISLTANGTAWNNGNYAEILSSTSSAIILVGIACCTANAGEYEIDIATGTAGNEVVVTTIPRRMTSTAEFVGYVPLWLPLDNIGNGVRVAARCRSSVSSGVCTVKLAYFGKPL